MHPSLLRMIIVGKVHLCCHRQSELLLAVDYPLIVSLSREMLENRGEWMFYPDVKEYLRKDAGNIDFAVMKERLPLVHRYWQVDGSRSRKNCSRRIRRKISWTSVTTKSSLLDAKLVPFAKLYPANLISKVFRGRNHREYRTRS